MSLPFIIGVSGLTKQVLDHVVTYLDALSSSLATKTQQTTMASDLSAVDANVDTLLGRVPTITGDKTTLDAVKADTGPILTDTADMQPRLQTIDTRVLSILTDTDELVGDCNAILADTAALDARLNAPWAAQLNTTVSSRLSSAIRRQFVFGGVARLLSSSTGGYSKYTDVSLPITLTEHTKAFVAYCNGSCVANQSEVARISGPATAWAIGAAIISPTTMRINSPETEQATPWAAYTVQIVELY